MDRPEFPLPPSFDFRIISYFYIKKMRLSGRSLGFFPSNSCPWIFLSPGSPFHQPPPVPWRMLDGKVWVFPTEASLVGNKKFWVTPSHEFQSTAWDTRNTLYVSMYIRFVICFFKGFCCRNVGWKKNLQELQLGLVGWDILYVQIILSDSVGVFLSEAVSRWRVCF